MNVELIIHNIGSIISIIIAIGVAFFLFINGRRNTANVSFAMIFLTVALFYISHVIGVSVLDPHISRWILMGNLFTILSGAFTYHAALAVLGKDKEHGVLISFMYATAIILCGFFLILPDLFLMPSEPKMYFPNYYVPGVLHWVKVFYIFCVVVPATLLFLYKEYRLARARMQKKQIEYLMLGILLGYAMGFIPTFLIFDIPVDPLWGILFIVVGAVPLAYGAYKYELFNIQVIARQAFFYSLGVLGVGGFISLLNYANVVITANYPGFPTWSLALVSGILAVTISIAVWRRLREGEFLKKEFITTVSHKFRSPLTYIKWSTDNLLKEDLSLDERKRQVEFIRMANEKLVELTDVLVAVSDEESTKSYEYKMEKRSITKFIEDIEKSFEKEFSIKHFVIVKDIEKNLEVEFDEQRLKFVFQVFIENAIHYCNDGGTITISLQSTKNEIICSVGDTGVGMTKEELSRLFSKFYRTNKARHLDTEGMGIGLYIASKIIEKHDGRIWADSEGLGKGSVFSFALPRMK